MPVCPPRAVDVHRQLLASLDDFEAAVTASRAGRKPDFQTIFCRLKALASQLPADADPQLRHFLAQASYQKARAWLAARAS